MRITEENKIISLQDEAVGSIKHFVSLKGNRCTFYTNEYGRETCRPSLNTAATFDEVKKLRNVLTTILKLMKDESINKSSDKKKIR